MINIRSIIKRIVTLIFVIVIGFVFQTSVFPAMPLAGVCPNIMLVLTVMIGFMRGRNEGMIVGFLSGILIDSFFVSYFGLHSLIYLFIGYFNGVFGQNFYGDDVKFPILLTSVSDLFYSLIVYILMFVPRGRFNITFYLKSIIIPEILYTVLIVIIIFFPLFKLDEWLRADEKRGVKIA